MIHEAINQYKTIYARQLLVGSLCLFVNHKMRRISWKDSKALRSEFSLKLDSHTVHKKLRWNKRPEETNHEYCHKMLDITSPINAKITAIIQYTTIKLTIRYRFCTTQRRN